MEWPAHLPIVGGGGVSVPTTPRGRDLFLLGLFLG